MAWVVALNVLGWPAIQLGLAWTFTRMPSQWFTAPASFDFEKDGKIYKNTLHIHRWKDLLPDAGPWFATGFSKASLTSTSTDYLRRFARETWRGELCHWCAIVFTPLFLLWNPWWGDLIIITYALAANMPCILAQRYNRIRMRRLIKKSTT